MIHHTDSQSKQNLSPSPHTFKFPVLLSTKEYVFKLQLFKNFPLSLRFHFTVTTDTNKNDGMIWSRIQVDGETCDHDTKTQETDFDIINKSFNGSLANYLPT